MSGNVQGALKSAKNDVVSMAKIAWKHIETIPTKLLLFGLVLNIGLVQSTAASASTGVVTSVPDGETVTITSFFGCANFNWAAGVVPMAREVTSIISGIGYVLIAALVLVIGLRYMLSGRNTNNVAAVQQQAKSWGIGAIIIVVGVPAVLLLLGGFTIGCEYLTA